MSDSIEQVLRKIVEEIFLYSNPKMGLDHIVHALLTSEEIEILDKRDVKVIGEPFRKED